MFACLLLPIVHADFGYNVFNSTCTADGTGAGGRNGFVLGNIGYGGCWFNDTSSGIVFLPCNPENTYKYAKTWADSAILMNPFFNGTSLLNNPSWLCYDWTAVDTNVLELTTGDLVTGRECNPNNVSTFKGANAAGVGGKLKWNLDCGFAGQDKTPVIDPTSNKQYCVQWDNLGGNSTATRLQCAPIDCEPIMMSSTLLGINNISSSTTRKYFCRDFLIYLKPMSVSNQVKNDNRLGKWNSQLNDYYYTDVNPGLYAFAFNQSSGLWLSTSASLFFGLINLNAKTMVLTPTNMNYELSQLCLNGNNSALQPFTYDDFFTEDTPTVTMVGDWYPLHVDMPPNTPVFNKSAGLEGLFSMAQNSLSLTWDVTSATTSDQNICINKAGIYNQIAEGPWAFIKNPGKVLQSLMPDWLKDMINLLAFIIDLGLCGVIIWFIMRVIKAFLELRLYLYQRKIFLVITPLIAYITWSLGSLIAFSLILTNELAFKTTMIFAGIHALFNVGTNNIIETAIIGGASVVLGMLPAYFYKVALILASVLILMTMLVLLYDAWFVYLKPLAYPKYKMNQ